MDKNVNYGLVGAWLIATTAFCLSLYGSEIQHLPVCSLCWYQRICMYPLTLILGIAAYRNDNSVTLYTLPLAVIGALFALYHYLEQRFPEVFNVVQFCSAGVKCSTQHFLWLGFITLPLLSFFSFLAIIVLLIMARKKAH